MMRRILVDHARRGRMAKRSGQWRRISLNDGIPEVDAPDADILDLDASLTRLSELDPRKSQIAELRFFAGLSLFRSRTRARHLSGDGGARLAARARVAL